MKHKHEAKEPNPDPLHYTLNILFEYEDEKKPSIPKSSLRDLLNVEESVLYHVRQQQLEPVEKPRYGLEAGYNNIENSFDYKANCDPNCIFTIKFKLSRHQEPYQLFSDNFSCNLPFCTIRVPLQFSKGQAIKTNLFDVLDLVEDTCEYFKLKVAERLELTDVLKAWIKLLAKRINIRGYRQYKYNLFFDLSEPSVTDIEQRVNNIVHLVIGDMLDLRTFGEFRTFFIKSAENQGISPRAIEHNIEE